MEKDLSNFEIAYAENGRICLVSKGDSKVIAVFYSKEELYKVISSKFNEDNGKDNGLLKSKKGLKEVISGLDDIETLAKYILSNGNKLITAKLSEHVVNDIEYLVTINMGEWLKSIAEEANMVCGIHAIAGLYSLINNYYLHLFLRGKGYKYVVEPYLDSVIQEYKLEDAEGIMYIGNDKGNYWCLDLYNLISGFDEYSLLYALDTDEERKEALLSFDKSEFIADSDLYIKALSKILREIEAY